MNSIKNLIIRIFGSRSIKLEGSQSLITKLMRMIDMTQEVEYSCDDVYELIDQYTELVANGEDAEHMMPLIKHHLDMCIDCREEYEILLNVVTSLPA